MLKNCFNRHEVNFLIDCEKLKFNVLHQETKNEHQPLLGEHQKIDRRKTHAF